MNRTAAACFVGILSAAGAARAADDAAFVTQIVPTSVGKGEQFTAYVTMTNTGTTTWSLGSGYMLGSQGPQGNDTWGGKWMFMDPMATVVPGGGWTFQGLMTAPFWEGDYTFQWQMVKNDLTTGETWFGAFTAPLVIHVVQKSPPCDGTELLCLSLTDTPAILASGGVIAGDVGPDGFLPAEQGGLDWHFGPGVDLSSGVVEGDVIGLLPQSDPSQPGQVSLFELGGDAPFAEQAVGLQRMMLGAHGNNAFRQYADLGGGAPAMEIWTDGLEATGWKAGETHHFIATWTPQVMNLGIDGQYFTAAGSFPFSATSKTFTLGNRVTHPASGQAVARFANLRLRGAPPKLDAGGGGGAGGVPSTGSGGGGGGGAGGIPTTGSGGAPGGAGGGGGDEPGGATGSSGSKAGSTGGCGCQVEGAGGAEASPLVALVVLGLVARRRRRRSGW